MNHQSKAESTWKPPADALAVSHPPHERPSESCVWLYSLFYMVVSKIVFSLVYLKNMIPFDEGIIFNWGGKQKHQL